MHKAKHVSYTERGFSLLDLVTKVFCPEIAIHKKLSLF